MAEEPKIITQKDFPEVIKCVNHMQVGQLAYPESDLASSSWIDTVNENYDVGMLSSLQAGLAAIGTEADWVLFALVDHPVVRGRTLDRLTQACRNSDAPLVIPRLNGQRGHPVVLSRAVREEIGALDPAASPQDVVRSHYGEALFVDVDDRGVVTDIDLPEDYDLVTAR